MLLLYHPCITVKGCSCASYVRVCVRVCACASELCVQVTWYVCACIICVQSVCARGKCSYRLTLSYGCVCNTFICYLCWVLFGNLVPSFCVSKFVMKYLVWFVTLEFCSPMFWWVTHLHWYLLENQGLLWICPQLASLLIIVKCSRLEIGWGLGPWRNWGCTLESWGTRQI